MDRCLGPADVTLIRDARGAPGIFMAQIQDITARKQAEEALARRTEELARSNAELEQFAYVASHDLQEPLRAVASYTALLAERYHGRLDERADQWIGYAIEGARHMQAMIDDLLGAVARRHRAPLVRADRPGRACWRDAWRRSSGRIAEREPPSPPDHCPPCRRTRSRSRSSCRT